MNNPLRARRGRLASAGALALALASGAGSLLPAAQPASAQAPPPVPASPMVPAWAGQLGHIKAEAATWVSVRVRSLDAAIRTVQSFSFLGSDGTALVNNMQADISGLQALDAKIQADTTLAAARADALSIFTEFRVYYLVLPVTYDVINVDHLGNIVLPDLKQYISELQADETSSNQAVIGPLVAGMQEQVQAASSATSGLSAQLLAFTPAEWDANHALLEPARAAIASADRSTFIAEREFYEALRYLDRHPTTTTTSTSTTSTPTTSTTAPQRLQAIQERAARAIALRLASLSTATALVQSKSYLGPDQATLVSSLQADTNGLQALEAKIQSDTTVAQALSDYEDIFTGFRVYYLVLPVVDDVVRVDYADNVAIPAVNSEISGLQAQVSSSDQGVLEPIISAMQGQVQTATAATAGLSAQLLAYTPAEWDADHGLLEGPSTNIATAYLSLALASKDYARALAYLRHGLGGPRKPAPGHRHPKHRPLPRRYRPHHPKRDRD